MVSAQFINIGNSISNDLQSIIPIGDGIQDTVKIQTLNAYGQTVNTYMWVDGADLDTPTTGFCWADPNYTAKTTGVAFGPGQGLWVYGSSTSQALQSAGEVNTSDVSVQLRNNATPCGNPFPVSVDLQDILPSGDGIQDVVKIQTLNPYGQTVATYMWVDGADLDTPATGSCWADPNYTAKTTGVTFAPGAGIWVYGSSTSQYLTFPAPEL